MHVLIEQLDGRMASVELDAGDGPRSPGKRARHAKRAAELVELAEVLEAWVRALREEA